MPLPKIEKSEIEKPLCYDPQRRHFICFDEIVSGREKIVPLESLSPDDLKTLVIERQRRGPDYALQPMSGHKLNRDEVIRAIESGEKIGRVAVEAEAAYLKEFLHQIQHHLDSAAAKK